ncbi:MAG: PepSY domain-containing protein [Anaerovoracaceae bacterium]
MKKLLVVVLVGIMTLAMVACGSNDDQAQKQTTPSTEGTTQAATEKVKIDEAKAKSMVLAKVKGAKDSDLRLKLDTENGKQVYEGEILHDGKEYDFEMDANSGEFVEWSEEAANK